mmetsp:Transcript_59319/g.171398  ORF Transcript_59319/g.171398 Transcript_59319/m.171398 type:complete len:211 (+) Transcript_59319:1116-1748(+)
MVRPRKRPLLRRHALEPDMVARLAVVEDVQDVARNSGHALLPGAPQHHRGHPRLVHDVDLVHPRHRHDDLCLRSCLANRREHLLDGDSGRQHPRGHVGRHQGPLGLRAVGDAVVVHGDLGGLGLGALGRAAGASRRHVLRLVLGVHLVGDDRCPQRCDRHLCRLRDDRGEPGCPSGDRGAAQQAGNCVAAETPPTPRSHGRGGDDGGPPA